VIKLLADKEKLMAGVFLTFVFLYALLWLIERKKGDIDGFLVAVVAIVPAILSFLIGLTGFLGYPMLSAFAALGALVVATYLCLWKILGLSGRRSAAYTAAVLAFNVVLQMGTLALTDS
jgi:hypothetical protein